MLQWIFMSYQVTFSYLESLHQAYMHCQSVEKTGVFDEDLQWLICATDIFDHYRKKEGNINCA